MALIQVLHRSKKVGQKKLQFLVSSRGSNFFFHPPRQAFTMPATEQGLAWIFITRSFSEGSVPRSRVGLGLAGKRLEPIHANSCETSNTLQTKF